MEACPTDAITHGHGFEIASFNTSTLNYRKEQLLAPLPAGATGSVTVNEEPVSAGHETCNDGSYVPPTRSYCKPYSALMAFKFSIA